MEQERKTAEKGDSLCEFPDAIYQKLVRMLISAAIEEEKRDKKAKEINSSKGG